MTNEQKIYVTRAEELVNRVWCELQDDPEQMMVWKILGDALTKLEKVENMIREGKA